jgi:hypothetical protein
MKIKEEDCLECLELGEELPRCKSILCPLYPIRSFKEGNLDGEETHE